MSFKNEINNILKKHLHSSFDQYQYTLIAGQTLYLEGHTGILGFDEKEISFRVNKKSLIISGTNLTVAEFDKDTAIITGNIESVSIR